MSMYIAMFVPTPKALRTGHEPVSWDFGIDDGDRSDDSVSVSAAQTAMDETCDRLGLDRRVIDEVELNDEGAFFDVTEDGTASTVIGRVTVVSLIKADEAAVDQTIHWGNAIGVSIPHYRTVDAEVVTGPDADGDYRVSYADEKAQIRGLVWFRASGEAVGKTTHRVVNV